MKTLLELKQNRLYNHTIKYENIIGTWKLKVKGDIYADNIICNGISADKIYAKNIIVWGDIKAKEVEANNILYAVNIFASDVEASVIHTYHNIHADNVDAREICCGGNLVANNIGVKFAESEKYTPDIHAYDITAQHIRYWAHCFATKNIKCTSIYSTTNLNNCKPTHKALDGKITLYKEGYSEDDSDYEEFEDDDSTNEKVVGNKTIKTDKYRKFELSLDDDEPASTDKYGEPFCTEINGERIKTDEYGERFKGRHRY